MDLPKKTATQLAQSSAANSDIEDGVMGTTHEVKRDLGRRHINMIAIAGMIVRPKLLKYIPSCLHTHAHELGHRAILSIRTGNRYRRTSRRSSRISLHGFNRLWCRSICRGDVGFHARHRGFRPSCHQVRPTCTWHRDRMELLVHHGDHSAG